MHGLVSLLPEPFYSQTEALWQEMEEKHGLRGIHVTPLPHFSWQIADEYDFVLMEQVVSEICRRQSPIQVRTAGLAIFSGERPVIYIPVVKDETLMRLHAKIWERTQPAGQMFSPYYSPMAWMPHISLAYQDVSPQNIGPVIQDLAFRPYNWEMLIDNITLIYEPEGEVGTLKFRVPMSG